MFRVYSKKKISKELFTVNLLQEEVDTVMGGNLFLDHPELKQEDCIVIERDTAVQNPIFDEDREEIREMTREEKILWLEEIDLLIDGEYIEKGEIKEIKYDKNLGFLNPAWDKENHIWYEKATNEEKEKKWVEIINNFKPIVLEGPFPFVKDGVTYYQKLRVDKDVPLVSSTLSTLTRHPESTVKWAFDDENNDIILGLADIERLQDTGVVFTNAVYDVERDLKAQELNLLFTIEDYKNLVEEKLKNTQSLLIQKGE
ncbi:hypothetical protein [Fusobacterium ulcerans]|uniref:hypothetical protein n=1 Tax=Fusobacterium ulcerans TaxID=861 RepID=UPI00309F6AE6